MSATAKNQRTDAFEELVRELVERLEGVPLHDAQVGPVEEQSGRRAVTLSFGEADGEKDAPEQVFLDVAAGCMERDAPWPTGSTSTACCVSALRRSRISPFDLLTFRPFRPA
jgi:hypothetical protein